MSKILKAFQENEAGIRRFLSRFLSNAQDVDDSLQETFLKGFAAETKTEIVAPKAFLYRIARNVALYEIKKRRTYQVDSVEDSGGAEIIVDVEQPGADEHLDGRRKLAILAMAVATLQPQCRRAFLLRRVDGLRYKQIANRMDVSVSAVEKHVTKAVIKCNEYLLSQGLEPSEFSASVKGKQALLAAVKNFSEQRKSDE